MFYRNRLDLGLSPEKKAPPLFSSRLGAGRRRAMGFSRATMQAYGETVAPAGGSASAAASDDFLSRLQQAEARDSQQQRPVAHYRRQAASPEEYSAWVQHQQTVNAQQHAYHHHHLAPTSKSPSHQHVAGYRRQHRPDWSYVDHEESQLAYQRYAPPGAVRGPTGALSDEHGQHKGHATSTLARQQRSMFRPLASQVDMSQPTAGDVRQYQYRSNHLAPPTDDRMGGKGSRPEDKPAGGPGNMYGRGNAYGVQTRPHAYGAF